jgi:4-carboxymuconolactone decarboxylase
MSDSISFPLRPADAATFTGEAATALLADSLGDAPTRIYHVRFAPRARTHWHAHSGTQILLVQEGRCRFQREGHPVEEHEAGTAIRIPPGERHWHGAAPGGMMTHVAINLDNERTDWTGPVTDAEFEAFGGL